MMLSHLIKDQIEIATNFKSFFFFFFFKKQPYIPSRKAVEHVERTKHVGKKKKKSKDLKK